MNSLSERQLLPQSCTVMIPKESLPENAFFRQKVKSRLAAKICEGKGIEMLFVLFICYFGFMFYYQFRSPEKYDGRIDMKEYAFCSYLTFSFPRWLILILFFNRRLTKLPVTLVLGQTLNYVMGIFSCARYWLYNRFGLSGENSIIFKVWLGVLICIILLMIIDHEIYCLKHKNDI